MTDKELLIYIFKWLGYATNPDSAEYFVDSDSIKFDEKNGSDIQDMISEQLGLPDWY